ncbi:hypothetical protein CRUP_005600 [Coryphaenoides rupestris]|nr:hypothetical protein CRUP_005600 [Coryphaenoides rupestris]
MALANASYKELPAQAKAEYVKKCKLLREQYDQDLIHYKQQYGGALPQKRGLYSALKRKVDEATSSQPGKKRKDVGLPDKPPQNGFMLFTEEQRCGAIDPMPVKGQLKTCSKLWRKKTLAERDEYSARTKQLRQEYGVKLKTFISSMTQEKKELLKDDLEMLCKSAEMCSKVPKLMFPGEPKKPSWSGATVFCSEKIKKLASNVKSRDRFKLIASMWGSLSATEREPFSRKAKKQFERYTLDLHDWFGHEKYVIVVRNLKKPMVEPYRVSDSEDEDYLDLNINDNPEGDDEEGHEEEDVWCEDLGDDGVLWTHQKFTNPECHTRETTEDSSDYD